MLHKPDLRPLEAARDDVPLTRRGFIRASLGVGSLVIGFHIPLAAGKPTATPVFAPNAFIRIDAQGKVTLIMPQVEMCQGIFTAVAMILAEELDAPIQAGFRARLLSDGLRPDDRRKEKREQ